MGTHGTAFAQNRPLERAERQRSAILGADRDDENAGRMTLPEEEEEDSAADSTPLGVNVSALRLISHQSKTSPSPGPGSDRIEFDPDLNVPAGLEETLQTYLNEPISMALLSRLGKDIVSSWRESDYPLVDVYYPEQNITQGRLQIVVREAVLGEKRVEGARFSREELLLDQIPVETGDRVNRQVVQAGLDWLNENPVRQVNVIYDCGSTDGTSDLVIDVTETKQLTAYAGFANTGVDQTGENEWTFGFQFANPLKTEQSIGYQYTSDLDWDSLSAHSVFYEAFLPWRHSLRVIGAQVASTAENPILLGVEGESRQFTAEYRVPLPRPGWNRKWRHAWTTAFDYKTTNTDLFFGGVTVFASEIAIAQFRTEYEAHFPDRTGVSTFTAGLVASPGELVDNNDDANFAGARFGSEADYFYAFAEAEKLVRLPGDNTLRIATRGQASSDRLASTEQLLAGGYSTVRGYDESLVRGDSGWITNLELISREFAVCRHLGLECEDQWNAFLFYDVGLLSLSDPLPGETDFSLQSVGLGLRTRFGDRGFARASYGWAVSDHGIAPILVDHGKLHFAVTLTY